jgi:hypothetical protein
MGLPSIARQEGKMSSRARRIVLTASLLLALSVVAHSQRRAPVIWDERALADWATPVGRLHIRPGHYSSAEYYAAPAENLRTYPVYRPDKEPPGYWESLQKKKPEPLVDVSTTRRPRDWIAAGERAFREIDSPLTRTDDPALIAMARDPATFANVPGFADGTILEPRWVITDRGVMLTTLECSSCHSRVTADRTAEYATVGPSSQGVGPIVARPLFLQLRQRGSQQAFGADGLSATLRRQFSVPWDQDDRLLALPPQEVIKAFFNPHGVIPRPNGSPLYGTRVPDLHTLRYSRYFDATGTHRLRGPEDVARYGALITSADPFEFGTHHFLTDAQRRMRYRYADEVLYAIGMYLMSLEPPKNPNPPPTDLVKRGERVFRREKCGACHPAPAYTTGELTPALGFDVPFDHPNFGDVRDRSVGTDPGLALRTRKGTGFYKIPSLRGLWYRPRLLHDASIVSIEELFDPARLDPEYERKGWCPPGVTKGPVPGLEFLTKLSPEDKAALIAFLRSL